MGYGLRITVLWRIEIEKTVVYVCLRVMRMKI